MAITFYPGDIVFSKRSTLTSRLIRFFTRNAGESRSRVSHVALIVEKAYMNEAVTIEANTPKVELRKFPTEYLFADDSRGSWWVYRCSWLSDAQRAMIVKSASRYLNKPYSYWKVAMHTLDWVLQGAYVFRRLGSMDRYPICSWLVAQAYDRGAWITFDVDPGQASPDDIWDYVTRRGVPWQVVAEGHPTVNGEYSLKPD